MMIRLKPALVFGLKILIGLYIGSVLGYIISSVGKTNKDYFPAAFYPHVLVNEIISGNKTVI